jgi:hypothetical protein
LFLVQKRSVEVPAVWIPILLSNGLLKICSRLDNYMCQRAAEESAEGFTPAKTAALRWLLLVLKEPLFSLPVHYESFRMRIIVEFRWLAPLLLIVVAHATVDVTEMTLLLELCVGHLHSYMSWDQISELISVPELTRDTFAACVFKHALGRVLHAVQAKHLVAATRLSQELKSVVPLQDQLCDSVLWLLRLPSPTEPADYQVETGGGRDTTSVKSLWPVIIFAERLSTNVYPTVKWVELWSHILQLQTTIITQSLDSPQNLDYKQDSTMVTELRVKLNTAQATGLSNARLCGDLILSVMLQLARGVCLKHKRNALLKFFKSLVGMEKRGGETQSPGGNLNWWFCLLETYLVQFITSQKRKISLKIPQKLHNCLAPSNTSTSSTTTSVDFYHFDWKGEYVSLSDKDPDFNDKGSIKPALLDMRDKALASLTHQLAVDGKADNAPLYTEALQARAQRIQVAGPGVTPLVEASTFVQSLFSLLLPEQVTQAEATDSGLLVEEGSDPAAPAPAPEPEPPQ